MIEIRNIHKSFGRLEVLKGFSLNLRQGAVTAVLGPNASGKTTLMKSILGLVKPDGGEIYIKGEKLNGHSEYRQAIGYMPQNPRFPENLTAEHVFAMISDLRNFTGKLDEELIDRLKLKPELKKPLKTLSGGTRQKVSAVITFMFDPDIIILDEPTAGLDPVSSSVLKDKILLEKYRGKTVILTSHIMSEVEELADRVVYLLEGRVHFDGSVDSIIGDSGEKKLERAIARMLEAV